MPLWQQHVTRSQSCHEKSAMFCLFSQRPTTGSANKGSGIGRTPRVGECRRSGDDAGDDEKLWNCARTIAFCVFGYLK